jgi:hypothetical protein
MGLLLSVLVVRFGPSAVGVAEFPNALIVTPIGIPPGAQPLFLFPAGPADPTPFPLAPKLFPELFPEGPSPCLPNPCSLGFEFACPKPFHDQRMLLRIFWPEFRKP